MATATTTSAPVSNDTSASVSSAAPAPSVAADAVPKQAPATAAATSGSAMTKPGGKIFLLNTIKRLANLRPPVVSPLIGSTESRKKDGVRIRGVITSVLYKEKHQKAELSSDKTVATTKGADQNNKYTVVKIRVLPPISNAVQFTNPQYGSITSKGEVSLIAQYRCHKDELRAKFPSFEVPPLHPNQKWVLVPIDRNHEHVSPLTITSTSELTIQYWGELRAGQYPALPCQEAEFLVRYMTTYDPTRPPSVDNEFRPPSLESTEAKVISETTRDPDDIFDEFIRLISLNPRALPMMVNREQLSQEELDLIDQVAAAGAGGHPPGDGEDEHGAAAAASSAATASALEDRSSAGKVVRSGTGGPAFAVPQALDMNEVPSLSHSIAPSSASTGTVLASANASGVSSDVPALPGQGQGVAKPASDARRKDAELIRKIRASLSPEAREFASRGLMLCTEHMLNEKCIKVNPKTGLVQWVDNATFDGPDQNESWQYQVKAKDSTSLPEDHSKCDMNLLLRQCSLTDGSLQTVTVSTHMFKSALDAYGIVNEKLQILFARYLIPNTPSVLSPTINLKASSSLAQQAEYNQTTVDENGTETRQFLLSATSWSAIPNLSIGVIRAGYEIDHPTFADLYKVQTRVLGIDPPNASDIAKNVRDVPNGKPGTLICFDTRLPPQHWDDVKDEYKFFLIPNFTKTEHTLNQYENHVTEHGLPKASQELAAMFYREKGAAAPNWNIVPTNLRLEEEPEPVSTPSTGKPSTALKTTLAKPSAAAVKPVNYKAKFLLAVVRNDRYNLAMEMLEKLAKQPPPEEYVAKIASEDDAAEQQSPATQNKKPAAPSATGGDAKVQPTPPPAAKAKAGDAMQVDAGSAKPAEKPAAKQQQQQPAAGTKKRDAAAGSTASANPAPKKVKPTTADQTPQSNA